MSVFNLCAGVVIESLNIFVHTGGEPIIGSGVDVQHFPIMVICDFSYLLI